MRGNPVPGPTAPAGGGSIPAYAGEPPTASCRSKRSMVYPRVCGGTLSDGGGGAKGSIPAYAGEPALDALAARRIKVYPRVCGGTRYGVPCAA